LTQEFFSFRFESKFQQTPFFHSNLHYIYLLLFAVLALLLARAAARMLLLASSTETVPQELSSLATNNTLLGI
jgi:hypothetical protein